jgi:hypothetical protein
MDFKKKYLKYKEKYLALKQFAEELNNRQIQTGGITNDECNKLSETDLKRNGSNLLDDAIKSNNLEVVNCLLQKGVKFIYNSKYHTTIGFGSNNINLETYKKILEMLAINKDYGNIINIMNALLDSKFSSNTYIFLDTICSQNFDGLKDQLNSLIDIAIKFNLIDKINCLLKKGIKFTYDKKYHTTIGFGSNNINLDTYKRILEMLITNKDYNNIIKIMIALSSPSSLKFKENMDVFFDTIIAQKLDGLNSELNGLINIAIDFNLVDKINALLGKGVKFTYDPRYHTTIGYSSNNINLDTYKKILEILITNKEYDNIIKIMNALSSPKFISNIDEFFNIICTQKLDGLKDQLNSLINKAIDFNLVSRINCLLEKGVKFIYDPRYHTTIGFSSNNINLETYKRILEMLITNKDYGNIIKIMNALSTSKFKENIDVFFDTIIAQKLDGLNSELNGLINKAIDFNLVDKINALLGKGVKFIYDPRYHTTIDFSSNNINLDTYKKILEMLITNKDYKNILNIVLAVGIHFKVKSKLFFDMLIKNITKDEIDKYSDVDKASKLSSLLLVTTDFYFVEAAEWLSNIGAIYNLETNEILIIQEQILQKSELNKDKLYEDKPKYLLKLKYINKELRGVLSFVTYVSILYERDSKEFLDSFCNVLKTTSIKDDKNVLDNLYIVSNIAKLYNFTDNVECINSIIKTDIKVINDINLINREMNKNYMSLVYKVNVDQGIDLMLKFIYISSNDDNIEYLEILEKNINSDISKLTNISFYKSFIMELIEKYNGLTKDTKVQKILLILSRIYSAIKKYQLENYHKSEASKRSEVSKTPAIVKKLEGPKKPKLHKKLESPKNPTKSVNGSEIKSTDPLKDLQKCSADNNMLYEEKMKHLSCYSTKKGYKSTTKTNYDVSSEELSNVEQLNAKFRKCTEDTQNLRKEREENLDCYLYSKPAAKPWWKW